MREIANMMGYLQYTTLAIIVADLCDNHEYVVYDSKEGEDLRSYEEAAMNAGQALIGDKEFSQLVNKYREMEGRE